MCLLQSAMPVYIKGSIYRLSAFAADAARFKRLAARLW
jgi:hypothetical protein